MVAAAHDPRLTPELIETWRLYAQGVPIKQLTDRVNRCDTAVRQRLYHVCDALGVEGVPHLIKAAVDRGLIEHGTLPAMRGAKCPCCGDALSPLLLRVLVEMYHGHGRAEIMRRLKLNGGQMRNVYISLNQRFGGRGAQHYVAAAVRSGLIKSWMDANELGTAVTRDAADGRRHAHRPAVDGAEVPRRNRLQGQGGDVRRSPAAAVHHGG